MTNCVSHGSPQTVKWMLKQRQSHTKSHRSCQYTGPLQHHRKCRCDNLRSSHPSSTFLQQAELVRVVALGLGWGLALAQGLVLAQDWGLALAQGVLALEVGTVLGSCVRLRPAASLGNRTSALLLELGAQSFARPKNLKSRTWNRSEGKLHLTATSESNHRSLPES